MSSLLLGAGGRPAARLPVPVSVLAVALLVFAGCWLAALVGGDGSLMARALAGAVQVGSTLSAEPAARAHPLPMSVWALLWLGGTAALAAALLAVTQRGWSDMALAGASVLWCVHMALGARAVFHPAAPGAPLMLVQSVMLAAAALTAWYALRLLQSPSSRARAPALLRTLSAVVGLTWALWLAGRIEAFTVQWLVPLACLVACASSLVRLVEAAWRGGSMLRPAGLIWLVAACGAVVVGCALYELGARAAWQAGPQARAVAWLATRFALVGLLWLLLALRFDQLARMVSHLGRSHRHWRKRLRQVQRELLDTRDRLVLHDRMNHQRSQRDGALRDLHEQMGHRLLQASSLALNATGGDDRGLQHQLHAASIELRMACAALDAAPRPLVEALQTLQAEVAPAVTAVGHRLEWRLDARAAMVVMTAADTLQVQRIVHDALEPFMAPLSDGTEPASVCVSMDLLDGETGRHLRLGVHAASGSAWVTPAGRRRQLQRHATMLGAQLSVEGGATTVSGVPTGLELVIPLGR